MEIVGKGDGFRLNFECVDGRSASVILPADCVKSLLKTLPGAVEQALKAEYRCDTLKPVHPVGGWSLQAAAAAEGVILTLSTPDNFKVSFALTLHDAESLASSLGHSEHPEGGAGTAVN